MDDLYPPDPNAHLAEMSGHEDHEDFVAVHRSTSGTVVLTFGDDGLCIRLTPLEARDLGAHLISASIHHEVDGLGYAPKDWDERRMPTARQLREWLIRCSPVAQEAVLSRLLLHSHEGQLCYEADHAHLIRTQEKHLHVIINTFGELAGQLVREGHLAGYKIKQLLEGQFRERTPSTDSEGQAG